MNYKETALCIYLVHNSYTGRRKKYPPEKEMRKARASSLKKEVCIDFLQKFDKIVLR